MFVYDTDLKRSTVRREGKFAFVHMLIFHYLHYKGRSKVPELHVFIKFSILGVSMLQFEPKKIAKLFSQIGPRIHLLKFVAH